MSLPQALKLKRGRALVVGILTVPASILLLKAFHFESHLWPFVVGLFVYFRLLRANTYVVWLRRFHQSARSGLHFDRVLSEGTSGLCVPLTIQDSSFQTSYFSSASRLTILFPIFLGFSALIIAGALGLVLEGASSIGLEDKATMTIAAVLATVLRCRHWVCLSARFHVGAIGGFKSFQRRRCGRPLAPGSCRQFKPIISRAV